MSDSQISRRSVTAKKAEKAVRTLLQYVGEDPDREGLVDTPARFVRALDEWFAGYKIDPETLLSTTFEEVEGYNEIVVLRNIRLESHCEHHMCPIIGTVTVAYLPNTKVVGISKLARVVEAFAKRYQIQEVLTRQIAETINNVLEPQGVAVIIKAQHMCIGTRGIHKHESDMITSCMLGTFMDDQAARNELLNLIRD